ncbi:MAG: hypothetical protein ABW019_05070 [Chitinophagaceae bacterium]
MRKIVLAILLFFPLSLLAQRFGGTPPAVKWRQINTDTARIIFPQGLDSQAQRIAAVVHHQAAQTPVALGDRVHKIDIVLQNQTTLANGYVGLGPYRSEFYMTPSPNNFQLGSLSWPDQLAVHEYRHVQQFNNFRNGLSSLLYYLFGEEGYALGINASIPDWFYEGDAVYNETILSAQGRARLPWFMNAYPSLWQAGKDYSWMKLRNGSLKDYVPDHYNLGYLLVNYGREKYGLDFWSKVTKDASGFKGLFYPFQKAIEQHAGVSYAVFREQAFEYYKSQGRKPASATMGEPVFPVNKQVVTNYLFPYSISPDSLVYLRTAYNKRPAFFISDSKGVHAIRVRDISLEQQFSYHNGQIVYAAYESDPRWSWRDYSVIRLLDIRTGRQRTITRKTKYFTPDLSPGGGQIAAVQVAVNGKSELHILDAANGSVKTSISSPDISLFTDPKFLSEDSVVCAVRLTDGKMALAVASLATGSTVRLTPPSFNVVGYPSIHKGVIYFTASYGGNDDVFAIKPGDTAIYRLTGGPLGNYFVNVNNGRMTWSAFTAEGYQLQQATERDIVWTPVPAAATINTVLAYPVSHTADVVPFLSGQLAKRNFVSGRYSPGTNLLNFHSWRPYYEDPIFTFSLYGENVLNTLQTELYYLYNQNEKTSSVGLSAVYGKWFPYISVGSQLTFARQDLVSSTIRQWNQLDTRVGLSVPLNFTSGKTYKSLNMGTNYFLRNEFNTGPNKNLFGTNNFTYLHHFISWTQQVEMARQHIFPRLGYSVAVNHRYPVTKLDGYQFISSAALYLPGFLSNHSLVLTGSFQQRDTLRALFGNGFANARGFADYYRTTAGSRMWRWSANYHLPLWMPDVGVANILYLQRIRGNLFYDMQRLFSNNKQLTLDQRSAGAEFYVDTKWWNQYELTFGIRISRLLDNDPLGQRGKGSTVVEFVLPVSIIPR